MDRGKFIVLEGGEGAGKSSTVSWLKGEFPEDQFIFTREPGGTPNAEEIRNSIIAHREDELDTLTHLLLFEAARREHMVKKIIPALLKGVHVVCDRFSASTYAYQIVAGEQPALKEFFLALDETVRGGVQPDHTIFLDLDPMVGIERKKSSDDTMNVFDEKDIAFHTKVREGMREYLERVPHTVIDARPSQAQVREEVKRAILSVTQHG